MSNAVIGHRARSRDGSYKHVGVNQSAFTPVIVGTDNRVKRSIRAQRSAPISACIPSLLVVNTKIVNNLHQHKFLPVLSSSKGYRAVCAVQQAQGATNYPPHQTSHGLFLAQFVQELLAFGKNATFATLLALVVLALALHIAAFTLVVLLDDVGGTSATVADGAFGIDCVGGAIDVLSRAGDLRLLRVVLRHVACAAATCSVCIRLQRRGHEVLWLQLAGSRIGFGDVT